MREKVECYNFDPSELDEVVPSLPAWDTNLTLSSCCADDRQPTHVTPLKKEPVVFSN